MKYGKDLQAFTKELNRSLSIIPVKLKLDDSRNVYDKTTKKYK